MAAGPQDRDAGVPPQPTLTDGVVVLRPWRLDDAEEARLQHDEQLGFWFGWEGVVPSIEQQTSAIEHWHRDYADGRSVVAFLIEHDGRVAGNVDVKQRGDRVGELSWATFAPHRQQGLATRAVKLIARYAFEELDLLRLTARVEVGNEPSLRTALRAGLREEGIARQEATTLDRRSDFHHLALLRDDVIGDAASTPHRAARSEPSASAEHTTVTRELPPQPTLREDDITLRPWRLDDLQAARGLIDDEISGWFGTRRAVPSAADSETAWQEWQGGYARDRSVVMFLVEHQDELAGWVEVRRRTPSIGMLDWAVFPAHRNQRVATRALRLLVWYCFSELGLVRVESSVELGNIAALRTAGRAGLRREGVGRQESARQGRHADLVHLARLVSDPPPNDRVGFNEVLDSALPRKRVIVQGLLRNEHGQVLLCELVYKREWDLPGGVVDPNESPTVALAREIREELGLDLPVGDLLLVNWLPPWRGWQDACLFVFDIGVNDSAIADGLVIEAREIAAVHWCDPTEAVSHVAPYLAELLPLLVADSLKPVYLESGSPHQAPFR